MTDEKVNSESAGRSCPYCHTDLEAGEDAHRCDQCGALHHADCWQEGGGCSIFGCAVPVSAGTSRTGEQAPRPRTRRRLAVLAGGIAVGVLVAVLVLILKDQGKEQGSRATATKTSVNGNANSGPSRKEIRQREQRKVLDALALRFSRDPGGNWSAYLPTGYGWSAPVDRGNQNESDPYISPRYLTTLTGPNRDFIGVDTTPDIDPTASQDNYTVKGKRLPNSRISTSMAFADLITFENGTDECSGIFCAKALMSDGQGGGVAIVAGSTSRLKATKIAKEFSSRLEPRY